MTNLNTSLQSIWRTIRTTFGALCLVLCLAGSSHAQVNLTTAGSVYTQNFEGADLATTQFTQFDVNTDGSTTCPTGAQGGNGRWNLVNTACQAAAPAASIGRGGSGKALAYEFSTPNAANDWTFSPSFSLAAGKPYKFIYYYRSAGANFPEKMKVMVTSGSTPATATTGVPASAPVKDYPNIASQTYVKDSIMFTPTAAGTFYIAFKAESIADQFFVAIDDFSAQNLDVPANDIAIISIDKPNFQIGILTCGFSTTNPSVVNTNPAIDTAFCKADLTTLAGSIIPAAIISSKVFVAAL